MKYENPTVTKGTTLLPALTAAFAQPATVTCNGNDDVSTEQKHQNAKEIPSTQNNGTVAI